MKTQPPPRVITSPVPLDRCGMARSATLLGDRWVLLILRASLYGVRRFDDFAVELNASRSILTNRLQRLVQSELLERRSYREEGARARVEYIPTPAAMALGVAFAALNEWGAQWLDEPAAHFIDRETGAPIRAAMVTPEGQVVPLRQLGVQLPD